MMLEDPRNRAMRAKESLSSEDYGIQNLFREYGRYLVLASFNTIFFWILYELIYWLDPLSFYPATIAWSLAYSVSTVEAHYVHRRFTFKSNAAYKESLFWAICVYGIIGIISTITEHILVYVFDVHHRIAWAINMSAFGFMMFLGLRLLAFPPELDADEGEISS